MEMAPLEEMMKPFASAIFAKAQGLRALGNTITPRQVQRLKESISDDLKKATNFHPHQASVAAASEAKLRGVDLTEHTWHEQLSFDAKRATFIVEHKTPVSALREACLASPDEGAVLQVLVTQLHVVWLLRSEDDELTRRGFRHKRADPDEAYRLAGIQLLSAARP
jgi:hypothetical protein